MKTITLTPLEIQRFWAKVDKSGDCWLWQAALTNGYGRFHATRNGKSDMYAAHRVSYTIIMGEIPDGHVLDHVCRHPACVKPKHLRPVTVKQNAEHRGGPNANSTSGVHGVHWRKAKGKWEVRIRHNSRTNFYGYYTTLEEASAVAIAKRNELYTHNDLDRKAVA